MVDERYLKKYEVTRDGVIIGTDLSWSKASEMYDEITEFDDSVSVFELVDGIVARELRMIKTPGDDE